ncbi:MAG TPA: ATP-binding protein, partial [Saprospiraceae bacterium]|nr:ATP-binding protein [Saprospiraceae bacterium]
MNKILELINQGENVSVEFKEQEVHADSVSKEIVAMLNTSGGNILIGVSDDGIIKGVDASKDWDQWVSNIARNNIIP